MLSEEVQRAAPAAAQRQTHVEPTRHILAIDDDRMALMVLEEELCDLGYEVQTSPSGEQALQQLSKDPAVADVIIIDKVMPGMDGLGVVRQLKSDAALRHIPVVMLTGDEDPEDMRESVDVGVFYYLTKPVDPALLKSVLSAALRDASQKKLLKTELRRQRESFGLVDTCKCRFRSLEEAWDLASFMAVCFPDPERVLSGLAELLINAVEHGNLEIGYEAKSEFIKNGTWRDEIERRLELPEYKDRQVEAVFTRRNGGFCVVITDSGQGFNWQNYLTIDPSRAGDSHGRGIAQAITESFDKVVFNKAGNQVVGYVSAQPDLDW